jgi:tetratricopeptide (TPR) repeat protein
MINGEKCALCGVFYPYSKLESWNRNGGKISILKTNVVLAVLFYKTPRELEVCEICYENGKLEAALNREDLHEAHDSFGDAFSYHEQYEKAKIAFQKAIEIKESADCLAGLGYVEHLLGNTIEAVKSYNRALQLDSSHFIARENLKNLTNKN